MVGDESNETNVEDVEHVVEEGLGSRIDDGIMLETVSLAVLEDEEDGTFNHDGGKRRMK